MRDRENDANGRGVRKWMDVRWVWSVKVGVRKRYEMNRERVPEKTGKNTKVLTSELKLGCKWWKGRQRMV